MPKLHLEEKKSRTDIAKREQNVETPEESSGRQQTKSERKQW